MINIKNNNNIIFIVLFVYFYLLNLFSIVNYVLFNIIFPVKYHSEVFASI